MSSECIFVLRTQTCLPVWLLPVPVELTILFGSCARISRRTRWQPTASWMHHLEACRPGWGSLCLGRHASAFLALMCCTPSVLKKFRAVDFAKIQFSPTKHVVPLLIPSVLSPHSSLASPLPRVLITPAPQRQPCLACVALLSRASSWSAPSSWSTPPRHSLPWHKCRLFFPRFGLGVHRRFSSSR
jgi:hypothetical protein